MDTMDWMDVMDPSGEALHLLWAAVPGFVSSLLSPLSSLLSPFASLLSRFGRSPKRCTCCGRPFPGSSPLSSLLSPLSSLLSPLSSLLSPLSSLASGVARSAAPAVGSRPLI
jgi:hypothetical protein